MKSLENLTSPFRNSLPWLTSNTLYLVRHGSHAYGTNTPTSDEDHKGVAFAPREYYLGYLKKFEQAESHEPDTVIYEIQKFFGLAVDCNPSIIEVMWVDPGDIIHCDALWEHLILPERDKFLSQKAKHTFSGYAASQLKRIKTHRRWLTKPPTHKPTRTEYGLPEFSLISPDQLRAAESIVERKLSEWDIDIEKLDPASRIEWQNKTTEMLAALQYSEQDKFVAAGKMLQFDDNFLEVLGRERNYRGAQKEWDQYQTWKKERNEARAQLEAKYGYDTKHAMHLVRLLRMCREILEQGRVIVKRPDAEELLAIRNGAWTCDQLIEWAENEDKALDIVKKNSKLPHDPDRKSLDTLCDNALLCALGLMY